MENSRTRNSIYNFGSSLLVKVLQLCLSFASRTVFIYVLGAAYLGLNGLFSNILSFLSLSELGIGSAIAFLLYKPVASNDIHEIKIIMKFYKKCFHYIGFAIIGLGLCLLPFLNKMVNLNQPIPENLYLVYVLFLMQSAISYFFAGYKQALLGANQKSYILTKYNAFFSIASVVLDIIVLLIFRNFIIYLSAKIGLAIVQNLVNAWKLDKVYPYLAEKVEENLSHEQIKGIFKNVYSVFVFRLGSLLFNSVTNIVTSIIVGTIVVGYYSNYTMIVSQLEGLFMMAIGAIAAGVGNVMVVETKQRQYQIYKKLNLLTFFIYALFSICCVQLLNSFIHLWLGKIGAEYTLSQFVVILIVANMYTNCSCQVLEKFRTASGNFQIGRELQVIGGFTNIILSVILAKCWGFEGVLISPFLCKIFITVTPFVMRIGKTVFSRTYKQMLWEYYSQMLFVIFVCLLTWFACKPFHEGAILDFIFELLITFVITIISFVVVFHRKAEYKELVTPIINKFKLTK